MPEFRDINLPGSIYKIDVLEQLHSEARDAKLAAESAVEAAVVREELLSDLLASARLYESQKSNRVNGCNEEYGCCDCPVSCCYCYTAQNPITLECECVRGPKAGDRVSFEYCEVQRTVRLDIANDEFISGLEEARGGVTHDGNGLYKRFNWTGIKDLVIECDQCEG